MILGDDNIIKIFSIFHDGVIVGHHIDGDVIKLKIAIQYLAELIDKNYSIFYLTMYGVRNFSFTTWQKNLGEQPSILLSPTEVFASELDILGGEVKNYLLEIHCNKSLPNCDYCGGTLRFNANSVSVLDQGGKEYKLSELIQICSEYWEEWKNEK